MVQGMLVPRAGRDACVSLPANDSHSSDEMLVWVAEAFILFPILLDDFR